MCLKCEVSELTKDQQNKVGEFIGLLDGTGDSGSYWDTLEVLLAFGAPDPVGVLIAVLDVMGHKVQKVTQP